MGNPFVHVELNTTNLPKAKAFYAKLFDCAVGSGTGAVVHRRSPSCVDD